MDKIRPLQQEGSFQALKVSHCADFVGWFILIGTEMQMMIHCSAHAAIVR